MHPLSQRLLGSLQTAMPKEGLAWWQQASMRQPVCVRACVRVAGECTCPIRLRESAKMTGMECLRALDRMASSKADSPASPSAGSMLGATKTARALPFRTHLATSLPPAPRPPVAS